MANLDALLDRIWTGVGPECRELLREALRPIETAQEEQRPKLLGSFFWVNWARRRAGKERCREIEI
jgi:hypothetical protein